MSGSGVFQAIPLLAVAITAGSAVLALLWGVWTYKRKWEGQLQLLALQSLQHYLDLAVAHPHVLKRDDSQPIDAQYACFAVEALATAQLLWTLVGHKEDWQRSIKAIVRQHRSYLRSGAFMCSDFNPQFVSYLRTSVADLKCAESTDAE
jgi:hypothetical protein